MTSGWFVAAVYTVREYREFVNLRSGDKFDVSTQSRPLILLFTLNSVAQWYQQVIPDGMRSLGRHFCCCPCLSRLYAGELRSTTCHVKQAAWLACLRQHALMKSDV